jgi:hypothetical protein
MEQPPAGRRRRRIDRVTAADLLDDVESYPTAQLRQLRDDCRAEESRLSYSRRVLQGRLDIARTEQARRADDSGEERSLIADLPGILADEPSTGSAREARTVGFYTPPEEGRRADDAGFDLPSLSQVPDLDDGELGDLIARLSEEEAQVSEARRAVLANLDGLQAELVRRYREGGADIDDIMAASPLQPDADRRG